MADERPFDRDRNAVEDIAESARMSFLIGCEYSGRGAENTASSEQEAVNNWVRETLRRYILLEDVLAGVRVLEMHDGDFVGRKPTFAEGLKFRDWVLR